VSFFGISSWEFVIIALFVLIAFGPDKIPEIFKLLGKAAKMFREAKSQVEQVTSQVIRPEDIETLKSLKDPLGTQELKRNVATLLDPLKETTAPLREARSATADASSIWSSLSNPATSDTPADPAQPADGAQPKAQAEKKPAGTDSSKPEKPAGIGSIKPEESADKKAEEVRDADPS